MKTVSIEDLKKSLSALISEAEAGEIILITRHRRPVARLTSAGLEHLHSGEDFGRGELGTVPGASTGGRYLEVLLEDRRGEDG